MKNPYYNIFYHHCIPMWIYEPGTLKFLDVNAAAQKDYGYSVAEFREMTIKDIRPSSEMAKFDNYLNSDHSCGDTAGIFTHQRKDGSLFQVKVYARDIDLGNTTARLVTAENISLQFENKKLQETITLLHLRLRSFFDSSGEFCLLMTPAFEVLLVNKKARNFTREYLNREVGPGSDFRACYSAELTALIESVMPVLLKGPGQVAHDFSRVYADRQIDWKIKLSPVCDDNGQIIAIALIAEDITAMKASERKIRAQHDRLRAIAWKQSHLMRAPLVNLQALMDLEDYYTNADLQLCAEKELNKLDAIIREMVKEASDMEPLYILPEHKENKPEGSGLKVLSVA